jgi:archaemetzincin
VIDKHIYIVPIEFYNSHLLNSLSLYLSNAFALPTQVKNQPINLDSVFDPLRNQYNSSYLLRQLINNPQQDTARILGICNVDLFIPILTFVFGEAQLEGIGAIVSTHRLKNEFYGGLPDSHLLMERLLKEATHELGHTYGLYHCQIPGCVMNSSTYVEDIDEKSVLFCRECQKSIQKK